MEMKLVKEEKYWPSIGKWCVAFWSPEYGQMENSFHKNREIAEKEALKGVAKHINFIREYRATTEKTEGVYDV